MKKHGRARVLRAESLERRELLAADLSCAAEMLPPEPVPVAEVVTVETGGPQTSPISEAVQPQQRAENRLDTDLSPNPEAALKRPRDQDSRQDPSDATLLTLAVATLAVDETQPQDRLEHRMDEDLSPYPDAALKRPRAQDSQEDSTETALLSSAAATPTADDTQPQEQLENRRDADESPDANAALQRPREQGSR